LRRIWKPKKTAFWDGYAIALLLAASAVWAATLDLRASIVLLSPAGATPLLAYLRASAYTFTLTDTYVSVEYRLITAYRLEAPLAKITDVMVEQDPMGRLLGYGTVRLSTAGTGFPGLRLIGLRDPWVVRKIIVEAVEKARGSRA